MPGPRFRGPAFTSDWARLIWQVYGVNPLECPRCGGERRLIAVVMNDESLVRILNHFGESTKLPHLQPARAPPIEDNELCQLDLEEFFERQGITGHMEPQKPREETKTPKTLDELLARGLVYFAKEKDKQLKN